MKRSMLFVAAGAISLLAPIDSTVVLAQEPAVSPAPSPTPSVGAGQTRGGLLRQLDLTEAQRQQIKQIRQSTTDRKERRQAILQVLTPEQRAKLSVLRAQRRAGRSSNNG
jgi:Spy/CpxP family protein refolding chaperone